MEEKLKYFGVNLDCQGWGARPKVDVSRPSQRENAYVQTVPDGKCLYPDYRAFATFSALFVRSKSNMSRPSQTKSVYVQTFVRSCPDHRALQIKFVCFNNKVLLRPCVIWDSVILNARRSFERSFRSGHIDFRSGTSARVALFAH